MGVVLLEGLEMADRTTVSGMSIVLTLSLYGTAPIHLLQLPGAELERALEGTYENAFRHTARVFTLLFCYFCIWKADEGVWVLEGRCTP